MNRNKSLQNLVRQRPQEIQEYNFGWVGISVCSKVRGCKCRPLLGEPQQEITERDRSLVKEFKTERKPVLTFEGKRKSPWRGTDRIRSKGLKLYPAGVYGWPGSISVLSGQIFHLGVFQPGHQLYLHDIKQSTAQTRRHSEPWFIEDNKENCNHQMSLSTNSMRSAVGETLCAP